MLSNEEYVKNQFDDFITYIESFAKDYEVDPDEYLEAYTEPCPYCENSRDVYLATFGGPNVWVVREHGKVGVFLFWPSDEATYITKEEADLSEELKNAADDLSDWLTTQYTHTPLLPCVYGVDEIDLEEEGEEE